MDDLADDWTYDDENFDYNKRLQSDDEDNEMEPATSRPDPNWADHVERAAEPLPPQQQPYNYYEDMKKSAVGFVLDEDERKRNKKSEEVMKNIERARQRREEEENRYRRPGSEEYYRNEDRPAQGPPAGRRPDESSKENKSPLQATDRRDWAYEEKNRRPRNGEERRDNRFDERYDRGSDRYESGGRRDGYYAPRFERRDREEKGGRREEYRRDDPLFEDYKQPAGSGHHGYHTAARPGSRERSARGFEDRGRAAYWEEENTFEDSGRIDEKRLVMATPSHVFQMYICLQT
jgi:hypothetical protein